MNNFVLGLIAFVTATSITNYVLYALGVRAESYDANWSWTRRALYIAGIKNTSGPLSVTQIIALTVGLSFTLFFATFFALKTVMVPLFLD